MLTEETEDKLADLYDKALKLEKAGNTAAAAPLYQACLALDPADHCGASVRLASIGKADAPTKAPDAYVATLFDQHADTFDDILTGDLGYAVPVQLAELLLLQEHNFERMLDLGCGTGLSGMTLATICAHATGVDISEKMIDMADERQCYDMLFINEAVHFLEEWQKQESSEYAPFDLIVATDVLPYIGALEPLFHGVTANLTQKGCFAFSCETMDKISFHGAPWHITPHQRFAHTADYLNTLLTAHGFTHITNFEPITVRTEEGRPIPGWLVIAWKN